MFGQKNKDEVALKDVEKEEDLKAEAETEEATPVLSMKEVKALMHSKYEEKAPLYKKSFVIKNKRTGMIVELRAISHVQAAHFIGWRPRHTILIKEKDITVEVEAQAKIDTANSEIESRKENCPALQ